MKALSDMKSLLRAVLLAAAALSSFSHAACVTQQISIGATVAGNLTSSACVDHNANGHDYYFDPYEFDGVAGQMITITSISAVIDPDLLLLLPDGSFLYDDDSGGGTNAMIPSQGGSLTLPVTGRYQLLASTAIPVQTGPYTLALAAQAAAPATVVEFFNTTLGHYFMTADPAEAAAIDNGAAGPGWRRTGYTFQAYPAGNVGSGVCRFYGTPGRGPNSHFYTINPGECDFVASDPGWTLETRQAFSLQPPQFGACPVGTQPVYRAYNNGAPFNNSNHRFTASPDAYQLMASQGWTPEGVVMCTPGSTAPAF